MIQDAIMYILAIAVSILFFAMMAQGIAGLAGH